MKTYMVPANTRVESFRLFQGNKEHLIVGLDHATVVDWYFTEEDLIILNIAGKSFWRIFFKEPVPHDSIDLEINKVYEDGFEVNQEQVITVYPGL